MKTITFVLSLAVALVVSGSADAQHFGRGFFRTPGYGYGFNRGLVGYASGLGYAGGCGNVAPTVTDGGIVPPSNALGYAAGASCDCGTASATYAAPALSYAAPVAAPIVSYATTSYATSGCGLAGFGTAGYGVGVSRAFVPSYGYGVNRAFFAPRAVVARPFIGFAPRVGFHNGVFINRFGGVGAFPIARAAIRAATFPARAAFGFPFRRFR